MPTLPDSPVWLEAPSPWLGMKLRLRARCRVGETAEQALRDIRTGDTGRPFIIEEAGVRELRFSRHASQSAMAIDRPLELIVPYTRKMMAFLLFAPRPRHILMIGLGGGSLAKYCHYHLSGCSITVVESNPEVIALREEFCLPPDDARLKVVEADGAAFVARSTEEYDVILVDAYDRLGIAPSASDPAFYRNLAQRLSAHGVLVVNLVGSAHEIGQHVALASQVLNAGKSVVPMSDEENTVLFGIRRPALQSVPDGLEAAARRLQRALGLDFPRFLSRINAGAQMVAQGARAPLPESL